LQRGCSSAFLLHILLCWEGWHDLVCLALLELVLLLMCTLLLIRFALFFHMSWRVLSNAISGYLKLAFMNTGNIELCRCGQFSYINALHFPLLYFASSYCNYTCSSKSTCRFLYLFVSLTAMFVVSSNFCRFTSAASHLS